MSPTVFGYVLIFTLLLAAGAAAIEHGTRGRGAARHFWTAAIVLAVVAPTGALAWRAISGGPGSPGGTGVGGPEELATIVVKSGRYTLFHDAHFIGRDTLIRMLLLSRRLLGDFLARLNGSFATIAIVVWATLSLALIGWLVAGIVYWRRAQRSWRRTTLDGTSIDISTVTGPAVVGFVSHRIVLPAWAIAMHPEQRRLVLAHESEHIAARDPERLVLAIAALVVMPWNIGLWWCAARLRRAIELDCDTRVLRRFPSAKDYGYVLLEVASRGRNSGPLAAPMVALLRLQSELELRLRAMTRTRTAGTRGVIAGGIAATIAIAAAFAAPVPTIALRSSSPTLHGALLRGAMRARTRAASVDTGSKQPARILADQKAANDSLRNVERSLTAKLQYMPRNGAWLDSARAFLAGLGISAQMQHRALRFAEGIGPGNSNTTYFEFQVQKAAAVIPGSEAPLYPPKLRKAGIDGEVDAQFVVDATGRPDSSSLKITKSTNSLFAAAVAAAVPRMRFYPAEAARRKVRQLVQQPFIFNIAH